MSQIFLKGPEDDTIRGVINMAKELRELREENKKLREENKELRDDNNGLKEDNQKYKDRLKMFMN